MDPILSTAGGSNPGSHTNSHFPVATGSLARILPAAVCCSSSHCYLKCAQQRSTKGVGRHISLSICGSFIWERALWRMEVGFLEVSLDSLVITKRCLLFSWSIWIFGLGKCNDDFTKVRVVDYLQHQMWIIFTTWESEGIFLFFWYWWTKRRR